MGGLWNIFGIGSTILAHIDDIYGTLSGHSHVFTKSLDGTPGAVQARKSLDGIQVPSRLARAWMAPQVPSRLARARMATQVPSRLARAWMGHPRGLAKFSIDFIDPGRFYVDFIDA